MIASAESCLAQKMRSIEQKLEAKRKFAQEEIDVVLMKLKEAKKIAEKINLIGMARNDSSTLLAKEDMCPQVMSLRALYLVGSDALNAEIELLHQMKETGELYLPVAREYKEQISVLKAVSIDVNPVRIDERGSLEGKMISSSVPSILMFSVLVGAISGLVLALFALRIEKS